MEINAFEFNGSVLVASPLTWPARLPNTLDGKELKYWMQYKRDNGQLVSSACCLNAIWLLTIVSLVCDSPSESDFFGSAFNGMSLESS